MKPYKLTEELIVKPCLTCGCQPKPEFSDKGVFLGCQEQKPVIHGHMVFGRSLREAQINWNLYEMFARAA